MRGLLERVLNDCNSEGNAYHISSQLYCEIMEELERPVEPVLSVEVWVDGNMPCFNTTWHSFPIDWTPGEYTLQVINSEQDDIYSFAQELEKAVLKANGFGGVE